LLAGPKGIETAKEEKSGAVYVCYPTAPSGKAGAKKQGNDNAPYGSKGK